MRAEKFWSRVQEAKRQRDAAKEALNDVEKRLELSEETVKQWVEVQKVVQEAAQRVQTEVHSQIADVVTRCLAAVFGPSYEFGIEFERKRGKTEARTFFRKDGHEIDPTEESGFGVVDVAAFALRLACLKLHQPPVAPVLLLDEPFRCLDPINRPRIAELLEVLSREMGVQIILVTHDPAFEVGHVVRIG